MVRTAIQVPVLTYMDGRRFCIRPCFQGLLIRVQKRSAKAREPPRQAQWGFLTGQAGYFSSGFSSVVFFSLSPYLSEFGFFSSGFSFLLSSVA
jgi:hypothetical protein